MSESLLTFTKQGIYCPQADVYIDPTRKVERALITHGHSDHARRGHGAYLCTHAAKPTLQHRLGPKMKIESIDFGQSININEVHFSFHPAGHIIGSAQIRVEYKGEVWVVSGDYKTEPDTFTEDFELVPCHNFITECTFGLPIYKWQSQDIIFEKINNWWQDNSEHGITSIIAGYSLGKSQRILANLDTDIGTIYTHPVIEKVNEIIRAQGVYLPATTLLTPDIAKAQKGALVIAPPSVFGTTWLNPLRPYTTAMASGWMATRNNRNRRSVDRGFVLSDHGDWDDLNDTVSATGAEKIIVTHGYTGVFGKWLRERGFEVELK